MQRRRAELLQIVRTLRLNRGESPSGNLMCIGERFAAPYIWLPRLPLLSCHDREHGFDASFPELLSQSPLLSHT